MKHVVIVGGGFGGLRAARSLRRTPVRVTVVDRENHHLFQPLLYQVATAGLAATQIAVPIRSVLRKHERTAVMLCEVTDVDLDRRTVVLSDGEWLRYDYLVLAAGARTSWFGNEEWDRWALGLKDVRDGLTIRERVLLAFEAAEQELDDDKRRKLLTFVVVGGGPTGVEMAGALAELGRWVLSRDYRRIRADDVRVVLLEMLDRVLPSFHPNLSRAAERQLRELGVEVRLKTRVTSVVHNGLETEAGFLTASAVCWAPGVEPVALADELGVAQERRRIVVDRTCAIPGHPEAFVIGDMAWHVPEGSDEPLPGLAAVAMQQGRYVARTITRELRGKVRRPFRYRDKGIMATVGRSRAVAQTKGVRLSGLVAWLAWIFVHVALLIGFRNRVLVLFDWFWQYVSTKRGARLITRSDAPDEAQRLDRLAAVTGGRRAA